MSEVNIRFKLDKPLIFLDLEATGLHVMRDRIVQIGMIKYMPEQYEPEEMEMIINPGIPISKEAYEVHGIGPKEVANKPTFAQVAEKLHEFIGDADLAGYNSDRFDIPMLMEEFARCGIDFEVDNRRTIDVQKVFYRMEPRTLQAAVKFYCQKTFEDAHDALADVRATVEVLQGQIRMYDGTDIEDEREGLIENPVCNDVASLAAFTTDPRMLDVTQRLKYNDEGIVVFNFGKYRGKPVAETLYKDRQYMNWILDKEFSVQVKNMVKKLVVEYEKSLHEAS